MPENPDKVRALRLHPRMSCKSPQTRLISCSSGNRANSGVLAPPTMERNRIESSGARPGKTLESTMVPSIARCSFDGIRKPKPSGPYPRVVCDNQSRPRTGRGRGSPRVRQPVPGPVTSACRPGHGPVRPGSVCRSPPLRHCPVAIHSGCHCDSMSLTAVAMRIREPSCSASLSVNALIPFSKEVSVPPGPGPGVFLLPSRRAFICNLIRPRIRLPYSASTSCIRGKQLLRLNLLASPAKTPEAIGSIRRSKCLAAKAPGAELGQCLIGVIGTAGNHLVNDP